MTSTNLLPLGLGLIIFSFIITGVLLLPFIDILYKLRLTRKKEAPSEGKASLFDKLHDRKAGTPVGGGILLIVIVSLIFIVISKGAGHMGISIVSSFAYQVEIFIIIFTFISFGLLGLYDDWIKTFGKSRKGTLGMWVGLSRRTKFILQWVLAFIISYLLYARLGINFVHIPFIDITVKLGFGYVPFASFVIVSFANAFNITDGLDGLSAGLLVICLVAFAAISASSLDTPLSLFISLLVGSLIAFLYFNVYPARIILGDVGALSFGAILAVIGLLTGSVVSLVVIGGIFVIEIASSMIQIVGWKLLKKPILPLAPLHNTFLASGWEEPKIVMRAWLAGVVLAIFGLWLATI